MQDSPPRHHATLDSRTSYQLWLTIPVSLCLVQYVHMSPCVNVLVTHDAVCTAAGLLNRALTAGGMVTFTMSQSCLFCLQHRGQRSQSSRAGFKLCPKHTEVSFSYLSLQWCNKKSNGEPSVLNRILLPVWLVGLIYSTSSFLSLYHNHLCYFQWKGGFNY